MQKKTFQSVKSCLSAEPSFSEFFLAILAILVVDGFIFGKRGQKPPSAVGSASASAVGRPRTRFPLRLFSPSYWVKNVLGPIGSSPGMRDKSNFNFLELEKLFSCKARFYPIRPDKRSRITTIEPQKGEIQTSRISNNLRIWQSYSRVPQILHVLE